tara:strand:+ start:303 stop:653 length:351 start_codon:yes stop_codon:yes gene_type:complete
MATFPSITPQYSGFRKASRPNVTIVRFADGYEQRQMVGIAAHQNPKIFTLIFNVSETDADTIETFLDARAIDQDSFDYTPNGESSSMKFVCENWSKNIPYNNRAIINARFREVFEA